MSVSDSSVANGRAHDSPNHHSPAPDFPSASANGADDDDADLFGDADDNEQSRPGSLDRQLDDSELDSGDDEGRADRLRDTVEGEEDGDEHEPPAGLTFVETGIVRMKVPQIDELYLLNMPPFLGLHQKNFDYASYEPPDRPHDGKDPTDKFSAFSTATTSVFWRRDPKDPSKLQSNSRIIRWSDGSLTLQIGSRPKDQYRISTVALRQSFNKPKSQAPPPYDPAKDSQVYLAAPHAEADGYQIVAPVDALLRILPTGDLADESVLKLQQSLAAATNAHDPLAALKQIKEDPELAKKSAELFEKDRIRTMRKRDAAEEKLLTRKDRVLGRSGLGRSGAGLTIGGLEADDDGMPMSRGGAKKKKRRANRSGDIYSDDEDEDLPRRPTREDEYDLDDGFMAASDEELETYDSENEEDGEDDPDVDDLEIGGRDTLVKGKLRTERDRGQRSVTPKRRAEDDDGAAAAGSLGSPHARKKRRVIDDDDDDE